MKIKHFQDFLWIWPPRKFEPYLGAVGVYTKCAKSPISYLITAPPEFETSKLLLKAVALAYMNNVTLFGIASL